MVVHHPFKRHRCLGLAHAVGPVGHFVEDQNSPGGGQPGLAKGRPPIYLEFGDADGADSCGVAMDG